MYVNESPETNEVRGEGERGEEKEATVGQRRDVH